MFQQRINISILRMLLAFAMPALAMSVASADEYFKFKNGKLERPTDYREWVFVGAPVTPNELNDGKAAFPEFHNVYIDPESWAHWKKNGTFRDGTILVKELVDVGVKASASGNGYFPGNFIGLAATIKSSKLFADEPGNWAYFSFSTPDLKGLTDTAEKFATESCNACHAGAAADDFVFTQHYPVLRAAKAAGELGAGGKR
ncbi:MAG TPA: cytochrome P460 family protein [Woeseiaceae bacterium]|nr:cytochrome P460 family protein [Woeseiaceae bacterium]